jgi:tetratricopeptide (TPR) repeat protein
MRVKNLNKPIILFGVIWFLVVIVPGMYITLLNSYQWNEYLECRGYLAMTGLLIILLEILKPYNERYSSRFLFISLGVILVLAYLTSEEKNNYKDAPAYYESAVNDDPTRATFQYLAGQVFINNLYKKTNKPEYLLKAEKFLKAAMELRPNYAMYYRSMAAVYTYMSRHEIALSLLEKALALDSNQMDTYNGLGYTYYYLNRFDDEVKVLTVALKKWPDNQNIIYNLAVAYFALYNSDSALSLVKYSYKLDKSEKNAYELYYLLNEWGGTFIQNKYYEQGVAVLRYAADFEPKRYAAYENLMNYYLIVYNRPDSAAYFAKKLIERGRQIDKEKLEFLKPYMK